MVLWGWFLCNKYWMTHEGHVYRAHYTNEFTQVRSCFISSVANQQIIDYLPGLATAVMLRKCIVPDCAIRQCCWQFVVIPKRWSERRRAGNHRAFLQLCQGTVRHRLMLWKDRCNVLVQFSVVVFFWPWKVFVQAPWHCLEGKHWIYTVFLIN